MMSAYRLVLVLISFVMLQTICDAGLLPAKRTINIVNSVYVGRSVDITVHCKSGDDDLGQHILPYDGTYTFRFRPKESSLFYCSFAWQNQFKRYDIYKDGRDRELCRVCKWVITKEGPCVWNYGKQDLDCKQWK